MVKKIARLALLLSLALVLAGIEHFFPLPLTLPGIKLGLANLTVVVALYAYGPRDAWMISVLRVVLASFLFGSLSSMLYALSGGVCALGTMMLLKRSNRFGIVGVSIAGGIAHNVAQILVAATVVQTISLTYYLPVLIISGAITGLWIGILSGLLLKRVDALL